MIVAIDPGRVNLGMSVLDRVTLKDRMMLIDLTVMPDPARCRVHSPARTTWARLQRAYAFTPS